MHAEKDACQDRIDLSLCPNKLIAAQRLDSTLAPLFDLARLKRENMRETHGILSQN